MECVAATLAVFCAIGLNINGFSVHIPYIKEALQLSHTQNANFILVRNLFSFAAMFAVKRYYEKLEIRLGMVLAVVLSAVSMFLYATAKNYPSLCMAAAVSGTSFSLGGMYPAAILLHRWFPTHEGLAVGICAAGSGLAIVVGAPILTDMTERFSMETVMLWEAGFQLISAVACFLMIQNYPKGILHHKPHYHAKRHKLRLDGMFFAIVAIGMVGGAFSFVSTHYTHEGMDPYKVSLIVSVVGLVLTVSKFMLGELFDLWGAMRANWVVFASLLLSVLLFSMGSALGFVPALLGAVLYGLGDAVATVGIATYAKDLSTPQEYAQTQQRYQTASALGSLLAAPVPGLIAEVTGNYRAFFLVMAVLSVFSTIVIQGAYGKKNRASVEQE